MHRNIVLIFTLIFLIIILVLAKKTVAQTSYKIEGIVADTASALRLPNAVINILNAKDSILISFKRSDNNGSFNIELKQPGTFLMMISYPGYLVSVQRFVLSNDKKDMDFKTIHLNLKSRFLKEIIVKGEAIAIKIKGDTTEFNARSYVIQPHAKVEDLLKQLPGLQIDQNGKITANGAAVKKVLLDGEEFFGDDPTLVTRYIRGDMVDKVQLYDKKSDQATFTGIEDGKKGKTINIKLKESANNGYFGKVEAGIGNDGFYQGQAMLNRFKSNNKFAFYGHSGNNGKVGLGWQDNEKYGSSFMPQNTFMNLDGGSDDFEGSNGNYNGQGLPSAHITGVHYDTHWGQKKKRINLNYKMGGFSLEGIRDKLTQNNLPFGLITNNSAQQFTSNNFRQKLDATYETEIDSTTNLKFSVFGSLKKLEGNTAFQTFAIKDSTTYLNASTRNITNIANDALFGSSAFVSKKFKTNRRTASLQIDYTHQNRNSEQLLLAKNSFYNNLGIIDSTQNVDQKKPEKIYFTTLNSNITYTEPLSLSLSLVVNAGVSFNQSRADRKSFNATTPSIYTALDSLLSNNFRLQQNIQQLGAVFNYNKGKNIATAGLKTLFSDYTQEDVMFKQSYSRNFINLNPQASYQYSFTQYKSLNLTYQGSTEQPTLTQLQPFRNNLDPLNEFIGNTNLSPAFSSNIDIRYNSYKVLSRSGFSVSGNYSLTSLPLTNSITTDALGKNTYQNINLSDYQTNNFSLQTGFNKLLTKQSLGINLMLIATGNTYYNIINTALNQTRSYNYSVTTTVSKYKKEKYSCYISITPNLNAINSSLPNSINNSGWGLYSDSSVEIYLPAKISIMMEGLYDYRQKTAAFDNSLNRFILNTTLIRNFLKDNSLKVSAGVNDLLNQNNGFNRNNINNMFVQETYTTIKRYFLFSLSWDFNKTVNTL